jgi:hypothetical protein
VSRLGALLLEAPKLYLLLHFVPLDNNACPQSIALTSIPCKPHLKGEKVQERHSSSPGQLERLDHQQTDSCAVPPNHLRPTDAHLPLVTTGEQTSNMSSGHETGDEGEGGEGEVAGVKTAFIWCAEAKWQRVDARNREQQHGAAFCSIAKYSTRSQT